VSGPRVEGGEWARFGDETVEKKQAAGGVLTAKQAPTGPAPPRRHGLRAERCSPNGTADRLREQETRHETHLTGTEPGDGPPGPRRGIGRLAVFTES
jgi:hypothetical protein